MKLFFSTRNAARAIKSSKGKVVDCGANAPKRWAIELKKESK